MIVTIKPQISVRLIKADGDTILSAHDKFIDVDLVADDFISAFNTLFADKDDYQLVERPIVSTNFLLVNNNDVVVATHPQRLELGLNIESFLDGMNKLIEIRDGLEGVDMLLVMGNIISLGNVQAVSLGVQSQYTFPTTAGVTGQVIGYQGTSQLQWISGSTGLQGPQGNQGQQGNQGT